MALRKLDHAEIWIARKLPIAADLVIVRTIGDRLISHATRVEGLETPLAFRKSPVTVTAR
jgi:hypothetical protein